MRSETDKEKADRNDLTAQSAPAAEKKQIGWCEYKNCGQPAYYEIDFKTDDMTADVCDAHFDETLRLFGLPDCEA